MTSAGNYGGGVGGVTQPEGMASGLAVAQEKLEGLRAHLDEVSALRRDAGGMPLPMPYVSVHHDNTRKVPLPDD